MKVASSFVVLVLAGACGGAPTQVSFVSNEQPTAQGRPLDPNPGEAHNAHPNGGNALPADERIVEPEHPLVETKQERALVHIHGPDGVICSGVLMGPRFVATAQLCVKGEPIGATSIAEGREYRVEIASSGLTWTNRRAKYAIVPKCDIEELDAAILVLAEPAPWVDPLTVTSSPTEGAKLQALGFGQCAGETRPLKNRFGVIRQRASAEVVIDVPLCRGDVGGPVVDGSNIVGLISHRDDPEGSPLRTTAITRLDTRHARRLLAQAKTLSETNDTTKVKEVSCRDREPAGAGVQPFAPSTSPTGGAK